MTRSRPWKQGKSMPESIVISTKLMISSACSRSVMKPLTIRPWNFVKALEFWPPISSTYSLQNKGTVMSLRLIELRSLTLSAWMTMPHHWYFLASLIARSQSQHGLRGPSSQARYCHYVDPWSGEYSRVKSSRPVTTKRRFLPLYISYVLCGIWAAAMDAASWYLKRLAWKVYALLESDLSKTTLSSCKSP